jgi:hypothetical protein
MRWIGSFVAIAAAISILNAAACYASHPADEASGRQSFTHTHKKKPMRWACAARRKRAHHPRLAGRCEGKHRLHASHSHRVRRKMLVDFGDWISPQDGSTLREAFNSSTKRSDIHWRTFWQTGLGMGGVELLYDVKHEGMGFYDGERVWGPSDETPDRRHGDHDCFVEHEKWGFAVTVDNCYDRTRYTDADTPYVQFWCRFSVAPVWDGFRFLSTRYNVHVNLHASGRLTFWWDDSKRIDLPAKGVTA